MSYCCERNGAAYPGRRTYKMKVTCFGVFHHISAQHNTSSTAGGACHEIIFIFRGCAIVHFP
jgi:hypothetical protein